MGGRRVLALMVAVLLTLGLAGCAAKKPDAADALAESFAPWEGEDRYAGLGQYVMTIGHVQPEENPRHLSLLKFQEDVENATCGHVRVVIRGEGVLGSEEEMLQEVMAGNIQAMRGGQYYYSPRMEMFTLPFLTQTRTQVDALLQSDLARAVCAEAGEQTGTVVLNICDAGGYRELSNAVRPVKTPADLAGLKIRVNAMQTTRWFFEALGAEPVTIPYVSLYNGLAGGVADGQDNPWINSAELKLYEVQPYFTALDYQFHPDPMFVNAAWFNALPQEFREILSVCAADMGAYNDQLIDESNQAARDAIAAEAEVYTPTAEELEAWKRAAQTVYDKCVENGVCTAEEIQELRQIVAQAD